ncbi:hypothetical protein DIPPA_21954 [Diplonema papillatum]|nr:hypothetical protein DIPPA_21954 [Diplonema papillatum]|eukprot:gene15577-23778_t
MAANDPFLGLVPTICQDASVNYLVARAAHRIALYQSPQKYLAAALERGTSVDAEVLSALLSLSSGTERTIHALPAKLRKAGALVQAAAAHPPQGRSEDTAQAIERATALLQCLEMWGAGELKAAVQYAETRVLQRWPTDFITLRLVCDAHVILGQAEEYLKVTREVEPFYRASAKRVHPFVLGMLAFGLQEVGDTASARVVAKKSLRTGVKDSWAVHAVAHSLTSDGQASRCLQYLNATADIWQAADLLAEHIWWHAAVSHVDVCKPYRALNVYDKRLMNGRGDTRTLTENLVSEIPTTAFALSDAAGILWRLYLQGVDVGSRAKAVVRGFLLGGHETSDVWVFTTCHFMLAALLAGEDAVQQDILRSLRAANGGGNDVSFIKEEAGYPICLAMLRHREGLHAECVALLQGVDLTLIGGSAAQRDTFCLTLLDACVRAKSNPACLALTKQRVADSPSSPLSWLIRANAEAGNAEGGAFDRSVLDAPAGSPREELPTSVLVARKLEADADRQVLGGSLYSLAKRWTRKHSRPPAAQRAKL